MISIMIVDFMVRSCGCLMMSYGVPINAYGLMTIAEGLRRFSYDCIIVFLRVSRRLAHVVEGKP